MPKQPAAKKAPVKVVPRKAPAVVEADVDLFGGVPDDQYDFGSLMRIPLKVKRNHPDAILPIYATPGAACFDLHALGDGVVLPGRSAIFDVGFSVEVSPGYVLKVYSRSGHGFKHGIVLGNTTGIIDSDYRGPMMACLRNHGDERFIVRKGDRIAQAMLEVALPVEIVEVEELTPTERGAGGLGSTGA